MRRWTTKLRIFLGAMAAVATMAGWAGAAPLTFDLTEPLTGGTNPGGEVKVVIDTAVTAGDVHIVVSNLLFLGDVDGLWLNYQPSGDIANASIDNFVSTNGDVWEPTISYSSLHGFDILFNFETGQGSTARFNPTDVVAFDLTADGSLAVAGFNLSNDTTGDMAGNYAMAHVISLPADNNEGSIYLGDGNGDEDFDEQDVVPEPGTLLLLGSGLLGLGGAVRRKSRKG